MISGIPMKTACVLKYIQTGGDLTFDFNQNNISDKHAIQYISFLKVKHDCINYTTQTVIEYMLSPALLGKTNIITDVKNLICLGIHGHVWTTDEHNLSQDELSTIVDHPTVAAHISVIKSLPHFLKVKSGELATKNELHPRPQYVGVNYARLFEDPFFLGYVLNEHMLGDWKHSPYYPTLFDEYIYGGESLIQFAIDNPDCELVIGEY